MTRPIYPIGISGIDAMNNNFTTIIPEQTYISSDIFSSPLENVKLIMCKSVFTAILNIQGSVSKIIINYEIRIEHMLK